MVLPKFPDSASSGEIIQINIDYLLGDSWVECGISKVNGFIKAMGFKEAGEAAAYCASVNFVEIFSTVEWVRGFVNESDARLLAAFPKSGKTQAYFGYAEIAEALTIKNNVIPEKPTFALFYQVLFTWMTKFSDERQNFINWWNGEDKRTESRKNTNFSNYVALRINVPVLKSFKESVDNFLAGSRPIDNSSGSQLVDFIHAVESGIIGLASTLSKWKYVSGDDAGGGLQIPGTKIGGGAGGGYYYFYSNDAPNIY